jgi:hypothetical protein
MLASEPTIGQVVKLEVRLHLTLYQVLREHNLWLWAQWGSEAVPVALVLADREHCPMLDWAVKVVHVREGTGPWALWVLTDPEPHTPAVRLGRLVPPGEGR